MTLDLSAERANSTLMSAGGITQPSHPGGRGGFLSDVIVELGFASSEDVDGAVTEARQPGKLFERILVERGAIDDKQLALAIAERNGLPCVDLDEFEIDESAAKLISRDEAMRYRALPLAFDVDGGLIVALADPLDALAISDIAAMAQSDVVATVASGDRIIELAQTLPQRPRFAVVELEPELETQETENVENELKEVPEMDQMAKDDPVAVESIPPPGPQTFELPEPMSAYEAAFGTPAQPPVESETVVVGADVAEVEAAEADVAEVEVADADVAEVEVAEPVSPQPVDNGSASELNELAVELGQAREENDQLNAKLKDSLSRIEELEGANERLLAAEQQIERLERERDDGASASSQETEAEHRLERERAQEIEARLHKRLAKARTRNAELEQLIDEMVSAVGTAHTDLRARGRAAGEAGLAARGRAEGEVAPDRSVHR